MVHAAVITWIAAPAAFFILCFAWVRSIPLALLAVLLPLPGALCAIVWGAGFSGAYGFGAAVAGMLAARLAQQKRGGSAVDPRPVIWATAAAILACSVQDWRMGAAWCGAALSAGLVLPLGSLLPLDEAWLVRANRAAERRLGLLETWALAATPRWGLALSGVALVLATVAFMRQGFHLARTDWAQLAFVAVSALAVCRDPRALIAAALAGLLFLMFAPGLQLFCFYALLFLFSQRWLQRVTDIEMLEQADGLALPALAGLVGVSWAAVAAPLTALLFMPAFIAVTSLVAAPRRELEQLYRR